MLRGENTIEVDAAPEECYALVVELDRYPEWQSQVRSAEVLERDGEGRPLVVETVSDARVRELKYRLRYKHEPPGRMSWTYVKGDVKDVNGEYRFAARRRPDARDVPARGRPRAAARAAAARAARRQGPRLRHGLDA